MEKTPAAKKSPKHLVAWPKSPTKEGKLGRVVYTSHCGKYRIEKRGFSSGRNGFFNKVGYVFVSPSTGKRHVCDTLEDAKLYADWEVDPNFEPATKPLKGA